jgi:hypothetical protein
MSMKQMIGCRLIGLFRKKTFLLAVSIVFIGLFANPWAVVDSEPKNENRNAFASGVYPKPFLGIYQAIVPEGILKDIKPKQSLWSCQEIFQSAQRLAVSDRTDFLYTANGTSITYGACTLFQYNNQQAFLRLDLPPPHTLIFC